MQISTELTEALAANPLLTQTVTPPEDIPLHIFYRTAGQAVVAPLIKYYGERLPPSEFDGFLCHQVRWCPALVQVEIWEWAR